MQALLMVGEGTQEIADIPVPEVPEGWALVRTIASAAGLFHTQMVKGMLDTGGLPRILGHEIVGEIVEAGSPASPPAGTLVVADAVVGCGVCEWCIRGEDSVCPWMRHLGIDLDGGFAEYSLVPESNLFPLPSDIPIAEAVMLSSALPAAVHAVTRVGVTSGARVAVSGVGSIGFTVCQVAKAYGATTIVAADVSDEQLAAVEPWVDATVNVGDMTPTDAATAMSEAGETPHGFDIAFETAGHLSSVETVIAALRPGGKAMMMGICDGPTAISFDSYLAQFVRREISLITTFGFTRRDFLVGNALYLGGRLDLSPLVGPTVALEDVPSVLAHIEEHGTGGKRYVVDVGMAG
ncbi:MAG: alcohol dehydrogenase catalytic domain-containing protein [Acidimicrobiia bacterium]|nr:alcohol dehydrogenase catalytic domain-containing protein [Acidimicrobiia bacterium]